MDALNSFGSFGGSSFVSIVELKSPVKYLARLIYLDSMERANNLTVDFLSQRGGCSRGVLIKRYSENMLQIYRKTLMSKCDFNNFAN